MKIYQVVVTKGLAPTSNLLPINKFFILFISSIRLVIPIPQACLYMSNLRDTYWYLGIRVFYWLIWSQGRMLWVRREKLDKICSSFSFLKDLLFQLLPFFIFWLQLMSKSIQGRIVVAASVCFLADLVRDASISGST